MRSKLTLLFVALLSLVTGPTRAFEAQIGDGTGITGYVPFYTLYNYSISESLFLASELEAAGVETGPMTSFSWYATNQPGYEQQGISIWVANVSDTKLTTTSHTTTGMTLVYTGAMTPAIGWNEFEFNEGSFSWDGTSNLLIYVQRNNGNWNSTVSWQCTTELGFNAMSYRYNDSDAYDTTVSNTMYVATNRPNIIIKGGAGVPTVGESTGAIDMTVPAGLGQMTPETAGQTTDLYYFLKSYLQDSPQPAYIKLTLKGGAEYECSQPMEITSAFELVGDDEDNLPTIMAYNGLVKIGDKKPGDNFKDANGFYTTIYNLAFKNINVSHLWYNDLFSTAGKKYRIPYVTFENCVIDLDNYYSALNFKGGGVAENITMTRSTFGWATIYNAQGGSLLSAAGVNKQTFDISYCDFYRIYSDALLFASTAADEAGRVSINFHHNIVVGNYSYYIQDLVQCLNIPGAYMSLIQYNAFQSDQFNGICTDWSSIAEQYGAAASVKGNMVMLMSAYNDQNSHKYNLSLGACPQRDAQIGDPRWLSTLMRVKAGSAQFDDDNDLAKVINKGVENGFTEFELLQNQYGNARYYLKQPIVADKAISIVAADKNIQIDASQNTGAFILMSKTPGVKANAKNFYEAGKLILKDLNVQGVNSYIYDDNKVAYAFEEFVVDNCVFELTNNKQDIDAPFRFQAGGPVQFALTNSTLYQTGSNGYKYFVKISSGNFPDKAFESFDGPYTWVIENNTFYKTILCGSGQKMEFLSGGRVANNYKKTAVSLQNNIFYECSDASKKDGFLKNLFGGKSSAKDMADFVSIATNYNTYYCNGAIAGLDKYDKGYMLTTDPGFKKPAEGDFTLSAYSAQLSEQTGDPRWFIEGGHYNPVTGIETVKTAEETSLENAVIYNLNGQLFCGELKFI